MQTNFYKRIKNCKVLAKIRHRQRTKIKCHQNIQALTPDIFQAYDNLLKYYDEILTQIDYFIFNSSITANIYKKFIPRVKGRIVHPVSGMRTKKYNNTSSGEHNTIERIAYIGRVERYKGVDILVDAMKNFPEIQCFLYGDDYSKYESPSIHNMGFFRHEDIQRILNNADLLIMPSRYYETFAFPVLEALKSGVPVLVSSHVGAKDLVKNAPVQVIFEPTKKSLCECIKNIQSKQNLEKYRAWIRDNQPNFTPEQHDKVIEEIYHEALSC